MTTTDHEQRLMALVGCIRGIVLEFDEHARYVNAWADDPSLLARPPREMIGLTINDVLGEAAGAPFTAQVHRVFTTGEVEHVEYPLDLEKGRRWFLADIKRVGNLGHGATVVFFARDITERRATEEALADSEERYRLASLATNDVMWDWNLIAGTLTWNDTARSALGFAALCTDIQVWHTGLHLEDRVRVVKSIEAAIAGDATAWSEQYRFRNGDDCYGDFIDRGFISRNAQGIATRMVGSMTDVTKLNRFQAQLLRQDRLIALGRVAAGVGHEINNPLTYVTGNLELALEAMPATDPARELIVEARDGARRIAEIVATLKGFTREDRGEIKAIDLHEVLERALRVADVEIRHRARLVRAFGPVPNVRSNDAQLGQVLFNVLLNATQAIDVGDHESNEIRIETSVDAQGRVRITIQDTGVGIAPELLERVFEPFFTTRAVGSGTGLGLATCHDIVRKLGGELAIASELGRGTIVTITLPAYEVAASGKPRVLVIDDEPLIGRMITRALRDAEVVTLTSARDALARLMNGEHFDLVLCDVMMPEMTGIEFHSELRRSSPELLHHVYFMTGGAFTSAAQAFLDLIGSSRLDKPVDAATLRALLTMHRSRVSAPPPSRVAIS